MADLVRAGLVESSIRRHGGYRLSRPASAIDLLAVVEAAERGSRHPRCVLRGGPCGVDGRCGVHELFAAANQAARTELAGRSLADIGQLADPGGSERHGPGPARTGRMAPSARGPEARSSTAAVRL